MSNRKISSCVNVRINVGNYQHIEFTQYAEEQIEFNSPDERIQKEDELFNELTQCIMRSLKSLPEKLGKGIDQAVEVQESIKKAIPAWLESNPVPNIANGAKKREIQATAEAKDNKDTIVKKNEEIKSEKVLMVEAKDPVKVVQSEKKEIGVEELFDDVVTPISKDKDQDEKDDLFGDDDLFSWNLISNV